MTDRVADDYAIIAARARQIRRQEGYPDPDWQTAIGSDLDLIADQLDICRRFNESDIELRTRIFMKRAGSDYSLSP